MTRPLVLASSSPRRGQLLSEHGVDHEAIAPHIDDGELRPGDTGPGGWVVALAYLKARSVADTITPGPLVLGCDTVVLKHDEIIGQPADEADARRILSLLSGGQHTVTTGVAIVETRSRDWVGLLDAATVTVGALDPASIEAYLASGDWRGKAGAYNLMERIGAGWPIEYAGDPTTVMGLPMRRLTPLLRRLGARAPERV